MNHCFKTILLSTSCAMIWYSATVVAQDTRSSESTRVFGGPDSVSGDLERTYQKQETLLEGSPLQSYYDWKQEIQDEQGFSFGLSGYWLYQAASDGLGEEDDAWGQIYRIQGGWTPFGRGTGYPGKIEYRIEHRSNIGSNASPSQLSEEIGAAVLNPGFGYSPNFDWDLSVINWAQLFNDQTAGFALGRLAFDAYLDAFPFQTFSRGFINRSFLLNPTVATTGIGALGAVAKGFVTDRIWIGGQIHDGNAVSGEFDMDTFDEGEWLKAIEFEWAPGIDRYKTDRIQFSYWDKDARDKAGVPPGRGLGGERQLEAGQVSFPSCGSATRTVGPAWRQGMRRRSDSSTWFDRSRRGVWVFGWAEPTSKTGRSTRDEYVIETSYKFQPF